MTGITLYGLDACDTCRKARNWLQRHGLEYRSIDYRVQPVPAATLIEWANQLGGFDALINRASSTWRNLPQARKSPGSVPEWTLLLREYPTLIKRPVLVTADGVVSVGFNDKAWKQRLRVS